MADATKQPIRPVALVTGATGGMGSAIVADLTRTHEVLAVGRSRLELERLAAGTGCSTEVVDLADIHTIESMCSSVPRLDVLVHAAAMGENLTLEDARPGDWSSQLAVNVIAPAELTRRMLPALRQSEGTVIFIGSGAGTRPVAGNCVYTATKHALKGMADVLRMDESGHRVRVTTIAPGHTDTEMLRTSLSASGSAYQPNHYIRPDSIAAAVRVVVDASPDVQITDFTVRPRVEVTSHDRDEHSTGVNAACTGAASIEIPDSRDGFEQSAGQPPRLRA